ncbi:putative ABC transport system permease protein [Anaerovirgula multivorans]|uniref:Putative hemin transport system permease protein HrtB n=1 Tax=Anaerovirgula multivorans TaxID=312168 RepID=A0A239JSU6_9FIRM|nr:ABC transporter permease [Anaerovirgula multivorans]SNT09036.1 putative ABC transport system permease protein [Anaerovirgula multivorans]
MGILRVIISNLSNRKLSSLLTTLSVSIGVILLIAILIISAALQQGAIYQGGGYDMIVGAKGSSSQLILSTIFHYDVPIGNIDYGIYEGIAADERVVKAIPLALGDSYGNYRIVGTDNTYFVDIDEDITEVLSEGDFYNNIGEVVIGSKLAEEGALRVGDTFKGAHGVEGSNEDDHDHDLSYTVVGVLKPQHSADDYIIFTMIESVWEAHDIHNIHRPYYTYRDEDKDDEEDKQLDAEEYEDEYHYDEDGHHHDHEEDHDHDHEEADHHHDEDDYDHHHDVDPELTAILVKGQDIVALSSLKREIEGDLNHPAQAAFIVVVLRQLLKILGNGAAVANFLAYISIIIAALSILISLMSSMAERRKDVAVMRMLGASKTKILSIVVLEALVVTTIGSMIGFIGGHVVAHWIGKQLQETAGLYVNALQLWPGEMTTLATVLLLGLLSGLIPALTVYRTEPTKFIDN